MGQILKYIENKTTVESCFKRTKVICICSCPVLEGNQRFKTCLKSSSQCIESNRSQVSYILVVLVSLILAWSCTNIDVDYLRLCRWWCIRVLRGLLALFLPLGDCRDRSCPPTSPILCSRALMSQSCFQSLRRETYQIPWRLFDIKLEN